MSGSIVDAGTADAEALRQWRLRHPSAPLFIGRDSEESLSLARSLYEVVKPRTIPICNEELPHCNDRCIHCGVADIMKNAVAAPFDGIERHITELAPRSGGRIMFAVSELTIRPDFLEILAVAKRARYHTIAVVTNARRMAYRSFAQRAVAAGATHFLVSIYGPNKAIHQSMTRTPESFEQTVAGIRHLLETPARLMTNTVVTNRNLGALVETVEFLAGLGVRRMCLSVVQIIGEAARHRDRLVPKISEVQEPLLRAVERAESLGVRIGVGGLPFCALPGRLELFGVDDLTVVHNGEETDQITERSPYSQAEACGECALAAICPGPQAEYAAQFGTDELRPVDGPFWTARPPSPLAMDLFPDLFVGQRAAAAD